MIGYLIQIDAYDPVDAASVTLRMASHDDAALCGLGGNAWWPVVASLPSLRYDLFDGAFEGAIVTPSSSFTVSIEPWPNFGRYQFGDARIRIWQGDIGTSIHSGTALFDGLISGQPGIADGIATIGFSVDDRWLDTPLLPTYAGTGGLEGPAAIKGTPKPLCIGSPRYAAGVLIDVDNVVLQLSHSAIEDVEAALDRLVRLGLTVGDYANLSALTAATIAGGRFATCKAQGLVRHGAPLEGLGSWLVKGDNGGPDGWVRKPGAVIKRIALLSGGSGKFDETSMDNLDTARPYNISLQLTNQTTAREVIQSIAASVNAVAGVTWGGKLFVSPVAIGSASHTLAADGSRFPIVADVSQIAQAVPFWKLAITSERAWAVHGDGDYVATDVLSGSIDFDQVTGGTKPADNATRNEVSENLIGNAASFDGYTTVGPAIFENNTAMAGQSARDHRRARINGTGVAGAFFMSGIPGIRVFPGETLYVSTDSFCSSATAAASVGIWWYDASGTYLDQNSQTIAVNGVGWKKDSFKFTAHSNAAQALFLWSYTGSSGSWFFASPHISRAQIGADVTAAQPIVINAVDKLATIETGADVTAQALPDIDGNLLWTLDADQAGTITTALPAERRFKAMLGGVDVSSATSFVATGSGGLAASGVVSINNTAGSASRGIVTIASGITGSGAISLTATFTTGAVKNVVIAVTVNRAAAPSMGGAGSTTAQDTTLSTFGSTSFVAVTDELIVRSDGSGKVRVSFQSEYTAGANVTARADIAYATSSGGSLTALTSDTVGSPYVLYEEPGQVAIAEVQVTLPAANTDYYFRARMRRSSGSGTVTPTGIFTVRQ